MVILLIQKFYTCIYLNSQLAMSNISKDAHNMLHLQRWCVNLRQRSPTLTVCLQYALAEQLNNSIVGMCYEYMYYRTIRVCLEHSCPTLPIFPIIFSGLIGEQQNCRCAFCITYLNPSPSTQKFQRICPKLVDNLQNERVGLIVYGEDQILTLFNVNS